MHIVQETMVIQEKALLQHNPRTTYRSLLYMDAPAQLLVIDKIGSAANKKHRDVRRLLSIKIFKNHLIKKKSISHWYQFNGNKNEKSTATVG